jgi:hypothetical protein
VGDPQAVLRNVARQPGGDTGTATSVDITSLESAVDVLRNLRDYVNTRLVGEAAERLKIGHPGDGSSNADVIFGGFEAAKEIATKHDHFYETVSSAYSALVETLDNTIDGTRRIIENYKTVEERNHASVADITTLLSSDAPPAGNPAPPPPSRQDPSGGSASDGGSAKGHF